jgi:cell division protein ZapA (FtsZ GTPase activity inhibitor)
MDVRQMSEKKKLKINIFGKDYSLLVDNEEVASELADYVNEIMTDTKNELPEQSNETIAVLAALNIAYDLFVEKNKYREFTIQATDRVKKMKLLLTEQGISPKPLS